MLSPHRRNVLVFCAFLAGSTLLWFSKALNDDVQRDIRCTLSIDHVPDSTMRVTPLPEAVNVSVRGAGIQLILQDIGHRHVLHVDYRHYEHNGVLSLGPEEMRSLARHAMGRGCQIMSLNPDTLSLAYTSRPPVRLPVTVDARISTLPNCAVTGPVKSMVDSVLVYSLRPIPDQMTTVTTQPLRLSEVSKSQTVSVPLQLPPGMRAVPDTVELKVEVEPMISRTATVTIRPVNVPPSMKLILMPSTVKVNYMMPMSRYNDERPQFVVCADYLSLDRNYSNNHIAIKLTKAKGKFLNVYLQTDSVEYIIEQK